MQIILYNKSSISPERPRISRGSAATNGSSSDINTLDEQSLKQIGDYKYLGSFISSIEKDFKVRKALA